MAAAFEEVRFLMQRGGLLVYVIIGVSIVGWFLAMRAFVFLRLAMKEMKGGGSPCFSEAEKRIKKSQEMLHIVGVLAGIAPLLGLLGTVRGMMSAFKTVEAYGTLESSFISAGISEAVLTTEAGLIVALPLMILAFYGVYLVERAERRIGKGRRGAQVEG
ncbi:MAG: MotA/TolQ/ExbB proton channel family protein [Planctomycetota bacterium]|nr:MotA/TolQ/ExbB proton channel family protein [Planctomycetota bacterium]